jgi:two-component system, LytTR family, response regulator
MTSIRALIVDDEEPARELLRAFLAREPEVRIIGEAGDGETAVDMIRSLAPDLVFLDVQMPGLSGLDVAAALSPDQLPLIVFVTAYDQYALRAFEVSACDYLLKPFDSERLASTMRRVMARRERSAGDIASTIRSLLANVQTAREEQIVVKSDGRHFFLQNEEIDWIEAVGKDLRLHLGANVLVVREPLNSLERRLDPSHFVRVHRSAIVNRTRIREVQPWFKGDYVLILRGGTRVVTGRTYRSVVAGLLDNGRSPRDGGPR